MSDELKPCPVLEGADTWNPDSPFRGLETAASSIRSACIQCPNRRSCSDCEKLKIATEALWKIRTAGHNEHQTSQWMQAWAAYGLESDKWDRPSDCPPNDNAHQDS